MTLAWRSDGTVDAPPLVLLNSIGTTTDMWAPLVATLGEQFHLIRIDHRGHGDSAPVAAAGRCSLDDLGADVIKTFDVLELDRAHVAGLSLGGMLGMWLAVHHPDRIGRLALLCTSAHLPAATWMDRAQAVRAGGMRTIADAVVARWVTAELAGRDPELMDGLRDMVAGIDPASYAQCCEAIDSMDLRPDLGRIAAPTLVLAGAQDPAISIDHAHVIADGVADARLQVLDPAAHLATVEQPGPIATALREHFRGGATLAAGYAMRRAVLGDEHVDRTIASTTRLTEPFQEFLTRYAWGDIWSRAELSRRERSIATLASLVAVGAEHELAMHVRAARRNGLTEDDIVEVLMHIALYAGLPRANRAIAIARDIFDG